MKEFIQKLPKTSIATIIGAIIIYLMWKWYIWQAEAELISQFLVAFWLSINLITKR